MLENFRSQQKKIVDIKKQDPSSNNSISKSMTYSNFPLVECAQLKTSIH